MHRFFSLSSYNDNLINNYCVAKVHNGFHVREMGKKTIVLLYSSGWLSNMALLYWPIMSKIRFMHTENHIN